MAVFGRKRRAARAAQEQAAVEDEVTAPELDAAGEPAPDAAPPQVGDQDTPGTDGPYDREQVPGRQGRLDLGSLWLTGTPGMQIRLDIDPQDDEITSVTAVLGTSAIQLQAFAAPKSEGIWQEIREEIAQSVTDQGGTAQEATGRLGTELLTRIPTRGPDGRTVHQQARFIGVDGPRWFLRGVVTGPAAVNAAQLPPLQFVMASAVVVRGTDARAPRELLPLTPPPELTGGAAPDDGEVPSEADPDGPPIDDLQPFERGPEITEIR